MSSYSIRFICWGWLAILVCTASAVGCTQNSMPVGFNLTADTMPGDVFYDRVITSSSPDDLCFRIRDRDRKIALSDSGFATLDYGDVAGLTLGNQVNNLPEGHKPACLLPAGEML